MARKKITRNQLSKVKTPKSKILNSADVGDALANSLGCAVPNGLVTWGGAGGGGNPYAPEVEQSDPLFQNLRWYLVSNMRQLLSQAYVEIGLIQSVVDVPVDDGLRGGVKISSKQLEESQIKQLQVSLERDDDLNTAGQAAKWNRLYGGAGILTIVGDQDPEEPLNVEAINENTSLEFRPVDMWELFQDSENTEAYDPSLQSQQFDYYSYYSNKIHKSRVMRLKGMVAPSFVRPRLRGWGLSVVDPLIRSVNQYLKATNLSFECLDEFKVDVFKIKNLVNTLMSPQGMEKIANRVRQANWQKNYQNALVMDTDDEWDHKQLSFAGLAEVMQGIRMQVAADMRMPITKLFGTSASAGLGNTDQNDMENYNSMVESQVRNKLKYDILRMCELKCQKMFGIIPDDLELEFEPLRLLSAVEEEEVKTAKFNRAFQMKSAGDLSSLEFRDIINKENLVGIQLDTSEDMLNPNDPEVGDIVEEDKEAPDAKPIANDGASEGDANLVPQEELKPLEDPDFEDMPYEHEFDLMSYKQDGGDDWIDENQMNYFEHPQDLKLWEIAEKASLKYLRLKNQKYMIWYYRKKGGQFGDSPQAKRSSLMNKITTYFKGSKN